MRTDASAFREAARVQALGLCIVIALGTAVGSAAAEAKSRAPCPTGQIWRVTKKICVPKGSRLDPAAAGAQVSRSEARLPEAARRAPPEPPRAIDRDPLRDPAGDRGASFAPTRGIRPKPEDQPRLRRAAEAPIPGPEAALTEMQQLRFVRAHPTRELESLVVFCRLATRSYNRSEAPREWAMVRNNLATALVVLDERGAARDGVEEAVGLYREAATERTRDRAPQDWATIQTNLGEALTILGRRRNQVAMLAEAVAVRREALSWAKRVGDEGVALLRRAETQGDKAIAGEALARIDLALMTIRDGDPGSVLDTYFEAQRSSAHALVEQLSGPRPTD
jgi:hypothetical protein